MLVPRGARHGGRGQAMVEFALVLPLFLALIFGVLDFGRAIYALNTITNAAREGARYGIISPSDTSGIQTKVQTFAATLAIPSSNITVSCSDSGGCSSAGAGDTITVAVSYQYVPFVIYVARSTGPSLTLSTSTTMTVQ